LFPTNNILIGSPVNKPEISIPSKILDFAAVLYASFKLEIAAQAIRKPSDRDKIN
jgi:hypothetical protein